MGLFLFPLTEKILSGQEQQRDRPAAFRQKGAAVSVTKMTNTVNWQIREQARLIHMRVSLPVAPSMM